MKTWVVFLSMAGIALFSVIPLVHAQLGQVSTNTQNSVWSVQLKKQVQISADVTNGQNTDQPFAYLVQVTDKNGVVVQLSWLTGVLTAGQSLSPSQSWTPTVPGNYTAQIFVWSAINNPDALSAPLTMKIAVA